jgi:TetR/AcrR family transcriptional regulator, mexJK operon transcriptional repressor
MQSKSFAARPVFPVALSNRMSPQGPKSLARARRSSGRSAAPQAVRQLETVDLRRERIVRLAAPLFLKKGYDNVSIDEIIGVVGGSKATIYAWFGGKEGLFEAVVRQKCQDVTLAIEVDAKGSLDEQLTHIGESFLTMVLSPPILEFHRLMVSIGRTFPEAGRLFFESGPVSAYSIVASWIARHQKHGAIVDEDPYRLAVLFLDMLIGEHQLGWLTSVPRAARREKVDETVRLAVRVFLRGCATSRE